MTKIQARKRKVFKRCRKCGKKKLASKFGRNRRHPDGLCFRCKACKRKYYEENKERISVRSKEYYRNNREKYKARAREYLKNAKRNGKWGYCEICKQAIAYRNKSGLCRGCFLASGGQERENAPGWIGGRVSSGRGYIKIYSPDHPSAAQKSGYVAEHRLIMEKDLGRYLKPNEYVHHINGIRDDNRIENLKLFTRGYPNAHEKECPKCGFEYLIG